MSKAGDALADIVLRIANQSKPHIMNIIRHLTSLLDRITNKIIRMMRIARRE